MYYPAPKNPGLRLEWKTWQKVLNKHETHITTQKRMKEINKKLYGLAPKCKSRTPNAGLNVSLLLIQKPCKSCSPTPVDFSKIIKNKTYELTKLTKEKILPIIRKSLVENPTPQISDTKIHEMQSKHIIQFKTPEEPTKDEDLFGSKKKIKFNQEVLPMISKTSKAQDLKLIGKKQVSVFKSFDIKRDTDTPRPWKLVAYDSSTYTEVVHHNMSVAVSTDTYFL